MNSRNLPSHILCLAPLCHTLTHPWCQTWSIMKRLSGLTVLRRREEEEGGELNTQSEEVSPTRRRMAPTQASPLESERSPYPREVLH